MISKKMIISERYEELIPNINTLEGFTVSYCDGVVRQVEVDARKNSFHFQFADGSSYAVDVSPFMKINIVYLTQFGISVTEDGKYFFVQSWESGLFCFDICTGALRWHHKRKKAYHLVVNQTTLLCHFLEQCISLINIESGEVITDYPLRSSLHFVPITDNYIIVGPKRNMYIILDNELNTIVKIPSSQFNPHAFETYIIHEADFAPHGIRVSGVEYSDESLKAAIREHTLSLLTESSKFERFIEIPKAEKAFQVDS